MYPMQQVIKLLKPSITSEKFPETLYRLNNTESPPPTHTTPFFPHAITQLLYLDYRYVVDIGVVFTWNELSEYKYELLLQAQLPSPLQTIFAFLCSEAFSQGWFMMVPTCHQSIIPKPLRGKFNMLIRQRPLIKWIHYLRKITIHGVKNFQSHSREVHK